MKIIRAILGLSPPCRLDALAEAREACRVAGEAIESHDRQTLDWGPSIEACARAEAETGHTREVHLPVAVDGVPSPEAEEAARVRREVLGYHDEDCFHDTPQRRQKDSR